MPDPSGHSNLGLADALRLQDLGSIGFSLPAALGAWAATQEDAPRFHGRQVVSVSGDGGLGQYLADITTPIKYDMNMTHVVLNNSLLGQNQQGAAGDDAMRKALDHPAFSLVEIIADAELI